MANFSLTDVFYFTIRFGFWLYISLDLRKESLNYVLIVTNLRHSKLLLKILVTYNMKNVISLIVRILGSNFLLTLLYSLFLSGVGP
jgi:hypothetical protein